MKETVLVVRCRCNNVYVAHDADGNAAALAQAGTVGWKDGTCPKCVEKQGR